MKLISRIFVGLLLPLTFNGILHAQENIEVDAKYRTADTNNAVIEGRVSLPSGFAAERYVKITLRNQQVVMQTTYTSKHGEFRFDNLSEGMYYVQAEVPE